MQSAKDVPGAQLSADEENELTRQFWEFVKLDDRKGYLAWANGYWSSLIPAHLETSRPRRYVVAMPTRARKRPRDVNQLAYQIVQEATGQAPPPPELLDTRNQAAVALSKLGASKGGLARAAALSPRRRSAIARKAVLARWRKRR